MRRQRWWPQHPALLERRTNQPHSLITRVFQQTKEQSPYVSLMNKDKVCLIEQIQER
jgi:hypothetical protein